MTNVIAKKQDNIEYLEINAAMDRVKVELGNILSSSPAIVRKYTGHLLTSSGKYIRAISLITCAGNNEGMVHPDAVKIAAAIELLHLATLVHDDVIDNASLRRGTVTLQKKYGKRTAVICGDYLLCIALKTAASISSKEDYLNFDVPDYMSRVCLGELNQHINNGFLDLSQKQYLKIISGKTAALFEASFHAGAVLGRNDASVTAKYMRLGRYIGMIFQMSDDCMDFEKTEFTAKKPVQSDYEQGVVTLPLIFAFRNMAGLKEKAKKGQITRNNINEAVAITGGLKYTRSVSKRYYDKALLILNELDITAEKRAKLKAILDRAFYL